MVSGEGKPLKLEDYQEGLAQLSPDELKRLLAALEERLQALGVLYDGQRSLLELEGLGAEV